MIIVSLLIMFGYVYFRRRNISNEVNIELTDDNREGLQGILQFDHTYDNIRQHQISNLVNQNYDVNNVLPHDYRNTELKYENPVSNNPEYMPHYEEIGC